MMRALAITAAALALTVGALTTTPAPAPPVVTQAAPAMTGPERLAALTSSATGEPLTAKDTIPAGPAGQVPVGEQLDRWLELLGYADEHAAGQMLIAVAPEVRHNLTPSGHAGGIYHGRVDGILLSEASMATPWVLAHEIGHWLQWRHHDRAGIVAWEINADAIATILLAGTEWEPDDVYLTPDQLELALEVIQGRELRSTDPTAVRPIQHVRYRDSYAPDRAELGVRYATRAEIRQARARLDGQWAALLPLADAGLTVGEARALAYEPWEIEEAWGRLGVQMLRVPDLLAARGHMGKAFATERAVVIDDVAAGGHEGVAEVLARDAGLGRCWQAALDLAAWRAMGGVDWHPVAADRCTVQGLMAAARAWQDSPWGSGAHVDVPEDNTLATRAHFERALAAADLLPDPVRAPAYSWLGDC